MKLKSVAPIRAVFTVKWLFAFLILLSGRQKGGEGKMKNKPGQYTYDEWVKRHLEVTSKYYLIPF